MIRALRFKKKGLLNFYTPNINSLVFTKRNYKAYKKQLITSLLQTVAEPTLYFLIFSYGISLFLGAQHAYIEFLFPGYIAFCGFNLGFIESSFGVSRRLADRGVFESIKLSPINLEDIAFSELAWSTLRALFCQISIVLVYIFFTRSLQWSLVSIIFMGALCSWLGAAMGLITLSLSKKPGTASYIQSLFILPFSAVSGVFFPVEQLPRGIEALLFIAPFTHATSIIRSALEGGFNSIFYVQIAILFSFLVFLTNVSVTMFASKLK